MVVEPGYNFDPDIAEDMGILPSEHNSEIILWRAVLCRLIKDALSADQENKKNVELNRKQAEEWFLNADQDFQKVCCFSGLEPKTVQHFVLDFITKPGMQKLKRTTNKKPSGRQKNPHKTNIENDY